MRKLLSFLLLAAGVRLLLYPLLCDLQSTDQCLQAIAAYDAAVSRLSPEVCAQLLESADPAQLDISGNGVIGYLSIPKLNILLPIYQGTSPEVLEKGAGLLEGTSLPFGGAGTHSVLSAHSGLPEARLFTGLDKLAPGDRFTITILDRQLTYEAEQILVTDPQDTSVLLPEPGQDLCTLLTCTPYGINSHRLLVRGRRVQ